MKSESCLSRRVFVMSLAGAPLAAAAAGNSIYNPVLLSHTAIWLVEAQARGKRTADIVDEALNSIQKAGYRRVELVSEFLEGEARPKTLAALERTRLQPAILTVVGPIHDRAAAGETRIRTVETVRLLSGRGLRAVNFTPAPKPDGKAKTQQELEVEAFELNRIGQDMAAHEIQLLFHNDTPVMLENAREWRYCAANADAALVSLCLDVEGARSSGVDPLTMLNEAGGRLRSVHLRNTRNGAPLERLRDGDIDMNAVAAALHRANYDGFLVVELLHGPDLHRATSVGNDLSMSRWYMQDVFGSRPGDPPVDMGPPMRLQ